MVCHVETTITLSYSFHDRINYATMTGARREQGRKPRIKAMDKIAWGWDRICGCWAYPWTLQQRVRAVVCRSSRHGMTMRASDCGDHRHPVTCDLSGYETRHLPWDSPDVAMVASVAS